MNGKINKVEISLSKDSSWRVIKQDESILGQPIFQNPGVPTPSNELGTAKPVFNLNKSI